LGNLGTPVGRRADWEDRTAPGYKKEKNLEIVWVIVWKGEPEKGYSGLSPKKEPPSINYAGGSKEKKRKPVMQSRGIYWIKKGGVCCLGQKKAKRGRLLPSRFFFPHRKKQIKKGSRPGTTLSLERGGAGMGIGTPN